MANDANNSGAAKNDKEKPDLSLIPRVFLEQVSRAFQVGEAKYGRYNYCKGHKASQLIAAAQRHISAWNEGEECDPIDGQHHLGAAGANLAMILRQMELETLKDDRYIGSKQILKAIAQENAYANIPSMPLNPPQYYTCSSCLFNTNLVPCPNCVKWGV